MNCGRCGESMEEGRVEVHATPGSFLFAGWSLQDLYWYDHDVKRRSRRRLVESGEGRQAFGCKRCGLVTIDTTAEATPASRGRRRNRRRDKDTES